MIIKDRHVQIAFVGAKELYLTPTKKHFCRFYSLVTLEGTFTADKIHLNMPMTHEAYFLFPMVVSDKTDKTYILVTFDEPLVIQGTCITEERRHVSDKLIQEFYYHLAYDYMQQEATQDMAFALAATEDIDAYQSIIKGYHSEEKKEAQAQLAHLLATPHERYQKGHVPVQMYMPAAEPLCFMEVVRMILEDPEASLVWRHDYPYHYIGSRTQMVEEGLSFIYPENGYGTITNITIGNKKLNIGARVRVEGMVEEEETGLKIGAAIYRDYNLIVNGCINTRELWCELSQDLIRRFRKEKLIKKTTKLRGRIIYTLSLGKLKVVNQRLIKETGADEVAEMLQAIQLLSCKEWALKKLLSTVQYPQADKDSRPLDEEATQLRKRFRIDPKGIYKPFKIEERHDLPYEVYPARIIEWKLERFPMKKEQEKALASYQQAYLDEQPTREDVESLLKNITRERKQKQNALNLIRLTYALTERALCTWDTEEEREKIEIDHQLGINTVLGDKIQVAMKKIGHLHLRQDCYIILARCNE